MIVLISHIIAGTIGLALITLGVLSLLPKGSDDDDDEEKKIE